MKTTPNKFRPQGQGMKLYTMRQRLKTGRNDGYQPWQSRVEWYPVGFKLNNKTICKQFMRLHYLACHSPEPITKRWKSAYDNFYKRHFGALKGGSVRYLNQYSCHRWL